MTDDEVMMIANAVSKEVTLWFRDRPDSATLRLLKEYGFRRPRYQRSEWVWHRRYNQEAKYAGEKVMQALGISPNMIQLDFDRPRFLALIQQWHKDHPRVDQIEHCTNVAHLLEQALDLEPIPLDGRRDMVLAALGHDLYEDSAVPPSDVVREFGREVDQLIRELTDGQHGVGAYVERVASGSEEARLIKLCDGVDNYGGLVEEETIGI